MAKMQDILAGLYDGPQKRISEDFELSSVDARHRLERRAREHPAGRRTPVQERLF
jgi:hypothetical protein